MPIYEYKCDKCGHKFEKLVLVSFLEPNVSCPRCQSDLCKRVVSNVSSGGAQHGAPPPRPVRRGG